MLIDTAEATPAAGPGPPGAPDLARSRACAPGWQTWITLDKRPATSCSARARVRHRGPRPMLSPALRGDARRTAGARMNAAAVAVQAAPPPRCR